jgi:PAS domain S-box-containing protein
MTQDLTLINILDDRSDAEKFQRLVEAIPDIVYRLDTDGNIVSISDAVNNIGYEPDELVGQPIQSLIHPDDFARCNREDVLQLYSGKTTGYGKAPKLIDEKRKGDRMTRNLHLRVLPKEGYREGEEIRMVIQAYGENFPSINPEGEIKEGQGGTFLHTVGIMRDVSERVRYEEEILEAKVNAERANQLKSEFLANLSHETRTPLGTILGGLDALRDEPMPSNQSDMVQLLHESAQTLSGLLDDLLQLGNVERGALVSQPYEAPLEKIYSPILPLYQGLAKRDGLEMVIRCPQPHRIVILDPHLLSQILAKLLSNAIKFTQSGGVQIELVIAHHPDGLDYLELRVKDTGSGVPPQLQKNIFTPFSKGDDQSQRPKGKGVGLALCREWVETMGGTIHLESKVGEGSNFIVKVPLNPDDSPQMNPNGQEPVDARLLVIHQEREEALRIQSSFLKHGLNCILADSPSEGIKRFMTSNVQGVVLSRDFALQASGALKKQLQRFEGNPIVYFSFHRPSRMSQDHDQLKTMGISDTLSEAFTAKDLPAFFERWRYSLAKKSNQTEQILSSMGLA